MICYTVVFIWLDANLGAVSACESAIKAPANWVRITPIHPSPSLKADDRFGDYL